MTHKGTVTLETERLILRRFELSDADAMFRNWVNDPEVTRFLTWEPHGSIDLTRKICLSDISKYADDSHYHWAVVPKIVGEPIGGVTVVNIDETCRSFGVAYRIGKAWWRQGFASEALSCAIKFLFEQVGVNRVFGQHEPNNPNSGAVMRKCGMKYEGTARQCFFRKGEMVDLMNYAILAKDYYAGRKLTFAPYDLAADRAFLAAAHTEAFRLTFKQEITPEYLESELNKPRDVRDGAYLDGKLIGICDLQRRGSDGGDYGHVNFFYIAPERRNMGLGGQLIAHAEEWCRARGLETLRLRTGRDNFQAQKAYEKNGFARDTERDTEGEFAYVKRITLVE